MQVDFFVRVEVVPGRNIKALFVVTRACNPMQNGDVTINKPIN